MCREVQELWMIKRTNDRSRVFFEGKSIQVSENENPKPSDTIRNDSIDQACSTTKRSVSTTASTEPSSGNVNSLNADLPEKPHQPKSNQFPLKEVGKQKRSFNPKWFDDSSLYINGKKAIL